MATSIDIFVNGLVGVFAGMAVLFLMMKILAVTLGRPSVSSSLSPSKTD